MNFQPNKHYVNLDFRAFNFGVHLHFNKLNALCKFANVFMNAMCIMVLTSTKFISILTFFANAFFMAFTNIYNIRAEQKTVGIDR